jgi:hypothetical protein
MEDVLEVYTRPYDPRRPQVCLDEASRQLLGEVNPPTWSRLGGRHARTTSTSVGRVCNLFLACEPLAGWRQVMVSDRRTRIDWAHPVKDLVDVHYPTPSRSCWSKTTSTPTRRRRCLRRSHRPRPGG